MNKYFLFFLLLSFVQSCRYQDYSNKEYELYEEYMDGLTKDLHASGSNLKEKYNIKHTWDRIAFDSVDEYDQILKSEYQLIENARIKSVLNKDSVVIIETITGYMPWFCFNLELNNFEHLEILEEKSKTSSMRTHFIFVVQINELNKGDYQDEKFLSDKEGRIDVTCEDYHFYGAGRVVEMNVFSAIEIDTFIKYHMKSKLSNTPIKAN